MKDLLSGKYRFGAPNLYFGFVDERDVAKAHVLALESASASGRFIVAERVSNFMELVAIIENKFPGQFKLPKMLAPKWLLYLVSPLFDLAPRFVARNVGHRVAFNTNRSRQGLGLGYTHFEHTVVEMMNQFKKN
ncbi:MAG TPA: hypothetical protein ENN49_10645 [Bacteroidales bacterium]|nr:hypothetical protein [Bacteroidales bacterium]